MEGKSAKDIISEYKFDSPSVDLYKFERQYRDIVIKLLQGDDFGLTDSEIKKIETELTTGDEVNKLRQNALRVRFMEEKSKDKYTETEYCKYLLKQKLKKAYNNNADYCDPTLDFDSDYKNIYNVSLLHYYISIADLNRILAYVEAVANCGDDTLRSKLDAIIINFFKDNCVDDFLVKIYFLADGNKKVREYIDNKKEQSKGK